MPLSIQKLEKLLALKGFIPSKYFVMHSVVVYMEILSVKDAETFLLYIPSKYKFLVRKASNVYKIKYLDIDNDDNVADNYAGQPDDYAVENKYGEVDISISPTVRGQNIAAHLEEQYKRKINLRDVANNDLNEIKNLVRQLKRLRFCVQNVRYKVAVLYKNFLCSIKRDDSIECYSIKKFPGHNYKKLYVVVDLELLYEKMDSLMLNMSSVRKGLYHILDKNHFTHTSTLQKLMEGKKDIMAFSENAYAKKVEYEKFLKESYEMLDAMNESEKNIMDKIFSLNEKYQTNTTTGLSTDIERSHQASGLEKKLTEIQKIKEKIVKTIFDLKMKRENTMLLVDNIMFDNTVMIDCVLRNFMKLGEIAQ